MAYNILKDYQPTGNKAIDNAAAIVMWHRKRNIALKAIHIKQPYYDWFKRGTEIILGRELEEGEMMSIDAVYIELGSRFQSTPMVAQTWKDYQKETATLN
jgi:hypothetical protein